MNDARYWLGFSLVPEIGPRRTALLLTAFGDLGAAWQASERELAQTGLERTPLHSFLAARQKLDLNAEMDKVRRAGAMVLAWDDPEYPALLQKLPDAPLVLYVRGSVLPSDNRALGVVGTRSATLYGKDAAYRLSRQIAEQGVTIVSGLAQGVDTAAHRGALDGGGRTFAVLGSGIDVIYPSDNRALAEAIVQNGALISEFPLGMRPDSRNFPRRNRIISGVALGVLVVEAPERSGALITASVAAEQGREVFAVPGNIFNAASRGCNRLIQDGAKLVWQASDVLDELDIAHSFSQTQSVAEKIAPSTDEEAQILQYMSADAVHIDDLARLTALPMAEVSAMLTILELKGLVRSEGFMRYSLIV